VCALLVSPFVCKCICVAIVYVNDFTCLCVVVSMCVHGVHGVQESISSNDYFATFLRC
jgi:hypothetical protein